MTKRIVRDLLIISAVLGGIWAAVTWIDLSPEEPIEVISAEKEAELGDFFIEAFLEGTSEVEDTSIQRTMDTITTRLLTTLDTTEHAYSFYVVRDDQINAFATLGGNIVVFSGLISFCERPEELAAVLAHEIGHVEERHVTNKLLKEFSLGVLFGVLTGGDVIVVQEILRTLASTAFDRSQEAAADDFALEMMEDASVHPHYLGTFFRRLREQNDLSEVTDRLTLISTHPADKNRVNNAFEHRVDSAFTERDFALDWDAVRRASGWDGESLPVDSVDTAVW